MHDRQPTPGQEGRMLITPENGAPAFFARVQMADNPLDEGTPLNTATLLKQQTASMFGLGAGAVPDDVYAWLGKYNQHWWQRRAVVSLTGYNEKQTQAEKNGQNLFRGSTPVTVQYADSITIDQVTGVISLVDPQSVQINPREITSRTKLNALTSIFDGKYATGLTVHNGSGSYVQTSDVYYIPSGTKWDTYFDEYDTCHYASPYGNQGYYINAVTAELFYKEPGTVDYVYSASRNAYPDSGNSGGFEWKYLGVPFETVVTAPKFEVGSYAGTGTTSHPIATAFRPKFVWVWYANTAVPFFNNYDVASAIAVLGYPAIHYNNNVALEITDTGFIVYNKSLGNNYDIYLNTAGDDYIYLALG